jgi:hypothetical protein
MSWLEILVVIGVIGSVIYQQVAGQAAVIATRAMAAGIPFAPEKDGRTFLSGGSRGSDRGRSARY